MTTSIPVSICWYTDDKRFEVSVNSGPAYAPIDLGLRGDGLSEGQAYTFTFSVSGDTTDDTFVSLIEGDGPQIGVRIPAGGSSVTIDSVTLGQKHLQLTAAQLVGQDPKVQVGWGSGTNPTYVALTWDRAWTVTVDGVESDPLATPDGDLWEIDNVTTATVTVSDTSTNRQSAVVGQVGVFGTDTVKILAHADLSASTDPLSASGSAPTDPNGSVETETLYSINLYNPHGEPDATVNRIEVKNS